MARYVGSACRLCRREGTKLFLKGDRCFSEKCAVDRRAYPPGMHGQGRTRFSDYGMQLREKQKVKRMYGLLEKQFRQTFDRASSMKGRAGENLFSPINTGDTAAPVLGAELYRIYCLMCHDARGNGEGPVVYRGMLPPPSLHAERAKQMADGEMFHILTRGQGNMASYAAQLTRAERWKVIQHVRRLQEEGP